MPNERTIPSNQPKSVCTYTLLSEGRQLSRTYHVLSITVVKELNRIPTATIIVRDGEPAKETFPISNQPDFEPGKTLEIKAGYRSDEKTVFKGLVIRHGIKVRNAASVLVIECKDAAVRMTGSCRNKYYQEAKDSEVIETLLSAHGLEKEVADSGLTHPEIVQYNCTDWDFMLCRVDANGMLCLASDGKVSVKKPDFSASTQLVIQYGATLQELDADIDARFQLKAVKATAWSQADQTLVTGIEGVDPGVPDAGNLEASRLAGVMGDDGFQLQHTGDLPDEELQAWADAMMLRHRLAKIRGSVRVDGTAAVLPGQLIELKGVGDRFAGKLFVTGVRQEIAQGNWQTVMQFGLDPQWFAQTYTLQQPLAGALLPAIQGLQIGVVTSLADDPEGAGRIRVRLPVIDSGDEGIWSRIATLDAGDDRGTFFLPEIDDEVIVGFLNNDPREAVVLGMLHSGKHTPPFAAENDNDQKGYVSRAGMKVLFDDDKTAFSIETPAGNKLLMTEEDKTVSLTDQHGNKITLDQNGISLESVKDIVLKATGDVKASGVNLKMEASAQAILKGGAGAECSSSGTTTVKGSIVQIN